MSSPHRTPGGLPSCLLLAALLCGSQAWAKAPQTSAVRAIPLPVHEVGNIPPPPPQVPPPDWKPFPDDHAATNAGNSGAAQTGNAGVSNGSSEGQASGHFTVAANGSLSRQQLKKLPMFWLVFLATLSLGAVALASHLITRKGAEAELIA